MSRNFGIGSRDLFSAGKMILKRRSPNGFKTQSDYGDRWRLFCAYAEEHGVNKMEKVSREFVIGYGQHLQRQLEAGVYRSASAPKNYLSAVNCVMRLATGGQWQTVKPGADCGIDKRQYIPKATKSVSEPQHEAIKPDLDERLAQLLDLQRTFGLRFKESCLLDAQAALKQAEQAGVIAIKAGTKGGRPRRVPCDENGQRVLAAVDFCFHAERHAYAQNRYRELVKAPCPLEAGWEHQGRIAKLATYLAIPEAEAKELDRQARLQISTELGHSRVEISHAYLG
jgi:site-specific recombinase XerD